jgi:Domain of unknown function (DUF4395)
LNADRNFIVQQGLEAPDVASCPVLTSALLFQPRLVGLFGLVAAFLQSGALFAALAAVLLWNALLPRWNPFDALYNYIAANRSHVPRLTPAPVPRRFAQGMAGTLAAGIAACLLGGAPRAAIVIEAVFFSGVAALVFGRFCLGSFLFHLSRGRVSFALRTLPWGRGV